MIKDRILKITASNTQSVMLMHLISTILCVYAVIYKSDSTWWLVSLAVYFCTGCLGITVTFHRYLSHRSYHMPKAVEYVFSIFGALGGTGSSLGWVALHRAHHEHSDEALDPHSPQNSKLNVFFSRYNFTLNKWAVRDLISDPFHKNLHVFYHLIIIIWGLFWLSFGFEYFLFIVAVPIAIQIWVSTASNIFNHWLGYRNFATDEKSTNNILIALLSWGEGWHNNHHQDPSRWNFKVKWWEFDISAIIIRLIKTGHAK